MTHPDRIKKGLYWDRAWSLVEGCTPVSEGCHYCWAAQASAMRACQGNPKIRARYEGLAEGRPPRFTGIVRLQPDSLLIPQRVKKPTTFSVWNDLFHKDVPTEFILKVFQVAMRCPQHTFLWLTKRPKRMLKVLDYGKPRYGTCPGKPLSNLWLGVSIENNKHDDRIIDLLKIPAAVHFVSVEPMLSAVNLKRFLLPGFGDVIGIFKDDWKKRQRWVICGAETGPGKRFMKTEWAKNLRDQCVEADVPFFLKKDSFSSRLLGGREWNEMPEREA